MDMRRLRTALRSISVALVAASTMGLLKMVRGAVKVARMPAIVLSLVVQNRCKAPVQSSLKGGSPIPRLVISPCQIVLDGLALPGGLSEQFPEAAGQRWAFP